MGNTKGNENWSSHRQRCLGDSKRSPVWNLSLGRWHVGHASHLCLLSSQRFFTRLLKNGEQEPPGVPFVCPGFVLSMLGSLVQHHIRSPCLLPGVWKVVAGETRKISVI